MNVPVESMSSAYHRVEAPLLPKVVETGAAARPAVLLVFGTRPEAIKLAPVIHRLREQAPHLRTCVCVTAQHREMLDQVLSAFDISVDHDLGVMRDNQTLFDVTCGSLTRLQGVLDQERPDVVIVQGDTTTAFAAALAAFYRRVPVAHVEAGLRTFDTAAPFPEEMNRRLIDALSTVLFAPTELAKKQLLDEGFSPSSILVTGNTGVDALLMTVNRRVPFIHPVLSGIDFVNRRVLLVTAHRRESFGEPLERICRAVRTLVETRPDVVVVYPVHLNPRVQEPVRRLLGSLPRVHLVEPLDYTTFVQLMDRCYVILTDSGGIQEEAPSLGKPVLVLRDATERSEAVEAGTAILVGTEPSRISQEIVRLLDDKQAYTRQATRVNPFGDGHAASRIVIKIADTIHRQPPREYAVIADSN